MNTKTLIYCFLAAALMVVADSTLWTSSAVAQTGCDSCATGTCGCAGDGCSDGSCGKGCSNGCAQNSCRCGSCTKCRRQANCRSCNRKRCPKCKEYCYLKATPGTEERKCFEVDYETICIPKVVPPWKRKRNPCEPCCAEARSVKRLTTKTYECPVCEYEWIPCERPLPQVPEGGPLLDPAAYSPPQTDNAPAMGVRSFFGPSGSISDQQPVSGRLQAIPIGDTKSTANPNPYLIQGQPIIPPAPPTGTIGDYFDGSRAGNK